jgi:hypothetical protein
VGTSGGDVGTLVGQVDRGLDNAGTRMHGSIGPLSGLAGARGSVGVSHGSTVFLFLGNRTVDGLPRVGN